MIALSFDVEQDLHSEKYKSLELGIPRLLKVLDKRKIKVCFFVPAKLIEKFPDYFRDLENQGHEIALHGYEHERFDDLDFEEKEMRIKGSVKIYRKVFGKNPCGFRAPQHSIDEDTLKILKKNKFVYDSSYTPLNFLQLLFFPKRIKLWWRSFFGKRKVYGLNKGFYEIPLSSFFIPFVSLPLRIFSKRILKVYLYFLKMFNKDLVFYAHSWDFIKLPESRIDRNFSYETLIDNLDFIVNDFYKDEKFVKMGDLIK